MSEAPFGLLSGITQNLKKLVDNRSLLNRITEMLAKNIEQEHITMSQITDWAAKEQADLDAISSTLDGIVAGVKALDDLITNFQNSPGTLSPSDQAALDGIQNANKAVLAKTAAIVVTPPTPPNPPTPPQRP